FTLIIDYHIIMLLFIMILPHPRYTLFPYTTLFRSRQNVKEIIYLSGIIPDNDQHLSRHLSSRLEVENILRYYGTPVTAIRAGLVVGPNGSSFPILTKLVQRLPAMILPRWTSS